MTELFKKQQWFRPTILFFTFEVDFRLWFFVSVPSVGCGAIPFKDKVPTMFLFFLDLESLFYVPPYPWLENSSVPWYYTKVPSDSEQNSNGRTPGYYNHWIREIFQDWLDIPESASGEIPLVSALDLTFVRCSRIFWPLSSCPNASRRLVRSVACVVCTK